MYFLGVIRVQAVQLAECALLCPRDVCGLHKQILLRVVFGEQLVLLDELPFQYLADGGMLEETGREQIRGVLEVLRRLIEWHDCLRAAGSVTRDTQHEY